MSNKLEKDVLSIKNELSLMREERRKERIISKIDALFFCSDCFGHFCFWNFNYPFQLCERTELAISIHRYFGVFALFLLYRL